jgi:hypothetical protein
MWTQDDDGQGMIWENALSYAENFELAEKTDWRLPNVKELQSILDYTRSPSTSNSAAIDPVFNCSQITDEGGEINYPFYWSGTTHANWQENAPGGWGSYVCFGEALGFMEDPPMSGNYILMDVHGAGAQRSDPKSGNPDDYPHGNGPQGDVVRILNYVRLVRDVDSTTGINNMNDNNININAYPNPASDYITIDIGDNDEISTITISNMRGSILYSRTKEFSKSTKINIINLTSGMYILTYCNSTVITNKKFFKK